ncbi:MAG TPA: protoglobin domain-containing protein [Planctomycetaceae bacterium]|nr:protoglobin domain-containing protein [Planctomycetaceae bacterium]
MPDSSNGTGSGDATVRGRPANLPAVAASDISTTLADRLQFLRFGEADRELLRGLQKPFAKIADEFFSEFYRLLTANPQVAALLGEPGTVDRLMGLQGRYFTQLLAGPYDEAYAESRLKIGATHERIGLEPAWYLGAYCLYTQLCFPRFAAELGATCPPALLLRSPILNLIVIQLHLQRSPQISRIGTGLASGLSQAPNNTMLRPKRRSNESPVAGPTDETREVTS